jgi:hypothetical protein
MSDDRRPLEISEEVARAVGLPEDLDATQREPYTIPSTRRRRTAGWIYFGGVVAIGVLVALGFPAPMLVVAGVLAALGAWHFVSAWPIEVLDPEALDRANQATGFAVGHASAVVGFDTWRAKPVWNVLVFSADEPPSQRGLVRVDARTGEVVDTYTEAVASID